MREPLFLEIHKRHADLNIVEQLLPKKIKYLLSSNEKLFFVYLHSNRLVLLGNYFLLFNSSMLLGIYY